MNVLWRLNFRNVTVNCSFYKYDKRVSIRWNYYSHFQALLKEAIDDDYQLFVTRALGKVPPIVIGTKLFDGLVLNLFSLFLQGYPCCHHLHIDTGQSC